MRRSWTGTAAGRTLAAALAAASLIVNCSWARADPNALWQIVDGQCVPDQQRNADLLEPNPGCVPRLDLVQRKAAYNHSRSLRAAVSARIHKHGNKAYKQRYGGYCRFKMLQHCARYHA